MTQNGTEINNKKIMSVALLLRKLSLKFCDVYISSSGEEFKAAIYLLDYRTIYIYVLY